MSEGIDLVRRPPLGFIVEGHGEYNCYPSLVCRIVEAKGFNVPRVNAGGYGNIARHLGDQLHALVLAHHPYHVIVTLDLKDVVDAGLYSDCADLRQDLEHQVEEWLETRGSHQRLRPLPERILAVVQVQSFESWMLADISGLRSCGYLRADEAQPRHVDDEVPDPVSWLRGRTAPGRNHKNPGCAREIISSLNPSAMRVNSRSFDKFHREVSSSFDRWRRECGISS
jgi:hypothetical protein